ncbi:MAG: YIP1 family protein [Nanoarchaeota archaeon]
MTNIFVDIIKKAVYVLISPKEMYERAERDYASNQYLTVYVGLLSIIPAIFLFLSLSLISTPSGLTLVITARTIIIPLVFLLSLPLILWIVSYFLRFFAERFHSRSELNASMKVVSYALTPILISPLFSPIPLLNIMMSFFLIIYSILLFIMGIRYILRPKAKPLFLYLISVLIYLFFLLLDGYLLDILQ